MKYVQIGCTQLRDPRTGAMLQAVPMYIADSDADSQIIPGITDRMQEIIGSLGEKMRAYKEGTQNENKHV